MDTRELFLQILSKSEIHFHILDLSFVIF